MSMKGKFNCDCIELANRTLEPLSYYVETGIMFSLTKAEEWAVMTIPLGRYQWPKGKGKRPKLPRIVFSYCPFCGTKTGDTA